MNWRHLLCLSTLGLLTLQLFLLDISLGSVSMSVSEVWNALIGDATQPVHHEIVCNLRLPRALTAVLAGVGLSISGLLMQTLFRNPLAGPYTLGVSSGATLGVALVMMMGNWMGVALTGEWSMVTAAIVGALLSLLLVLGISVKVRESVSLLIVGVMIGQMAGAIVNVMQHYSNPDTLKLFVVWTFGSLSAVGWQQMPFLGAMLLLGVIIAVTLMKNLNALLLGEQYAGSMGVSVKMTRFLIILSTGLLAGGITAFAGPIAFVGVAVPHIARGLMKTDDHRWVLPTSALAGTVLLLACDILSQQTPHPLPISTVCALFGAPVIIWIIIKGSNDKNRNLANS